jgi:hypothetical protein
MNTPGLAAKQNKSGGGFGGQLLNELGNSLNDHALGIVLPHRARLV